VKELPDFYGRLKQLTENIRDTVKAVEPETAIPVSQIDPKFQDLLSQLKSVLETKDMRETDNLLAEIEGMQLDKAVQEKVAFISEQVLMGEYDNAIESIAALMGENHG
jgi:hypothetical protein